MYLHSEVRPTLLGLIDTTSLLPEEEHVFQSPKNSFLIKLGC